MQPKAKGTPLSLLGLPLVPLYFLGWRLRLALHQRGIIPKRRLLAKVISVGNLTLGGSGKTPLVLYLSQGLQQRGKNPAVLTRGYGRKGREPLLLEGTEGVNPRDVGDEPFLLAKYGVPVLVEKDRAQSGMRAQIKGFSPLILDDGYQYLGLHRDVDILTIDSSNPWGNGFLLPAGPLREPLGEMRRADIIILNRVDQAGDLAALKQKLRNIRGECPLFEAYYLPHSLHWLQGKEEISPGELKGRRVYALSAIGSPASFESTLEGLGAILVGKRRFLDHHLYKKMELARVEQAARRKGATWMVTTEKDEVKLTHLPPGNLPLLSLHMRLTIEEEENFWQAMDSLMGKEQL